ncbi:hypothetical protein ACI8AC_21095 [Geodermatophilus sp. SYSU D00758]
MQPTSPVSPVSPLSAHLHGVVTAGAQWLLTAFPPPAGALAGVRAQAQARAATTVAALLRHPTALDDQLLELCGPGGCVGLDRVSGAVRGPDADSRDPWRTWVDEVVVSWAAVLLGEPAVARRAARAVGERDDGPLGAPAARDLAAGGLLRHPDLLAPVADLHRDALLVTLTGRGA